MYKQIICLVFLVAAINAQALVGWTHCPEPFERMATVNEIHVQNCTTVPCSFNRGDTYRFQIVAISHVHSNTLQYELTADFLGMPLPLVSGEGCASLVEGQCPATPDARFSYVLHYTVPANLPDIRTFVQLVVRHHTGYMGICIRVLVVPH